MSDDLRLFVAVVAPPAVQAVVAAAQAVLRPMTTYVRWTAPGNTHLTLQFLGPTAPDRVSIRVRAGGALCGPRARSLTLAAGVTAAAAMIPAKYSQSRRE